MNEKEVVELMKSSNSEQEWSDNCKKVKDSCGGYPEFWYRAILLSGICRETSAKWGGNDKIRISFG